MIGAFRTAAVLLTAASLTAFSAAQQGDPFAFDEVTTPAGISGFGPSFGPGAWGDVNGDGLPDLWVGNHASPTQLFVQQAGGGFVDETDLWLQDTLTRDTHGVAWADADGDGDQDLAELVGSGNSVTGQNRLWLNDGGRLTDVAPASGVGFADGRGRTPLWVDYDQDGRLDLITINLYRAGISASLPYRQISAAGQPLSFVMDWPGSGFEPSTQNNEFAQLADLTGDGVLDLIVDGSPFPSRLYDLSVSPMEDRLIGSGFTGVPNVVDAVFADFDLDGRVDMYLSRDRIESDSEAVLVNDDELRAKLFAKREKKAPEAISA